MIEAEHTVLLGAVEAPLGLIPLFPLLGSILAYLVGRFKKDLSGWVATGASLFSFIFVLGFYFALRTDSPETATVIEHNVFSWISVGTLNIDFIFRFDALSAVMCLVVTGVGSMIHLYSIGYMAHDESRPRFFAYLNLFMFSMLLLVLGGNLLVLFVGWEGVGLCSYLLIGFWHKNLSYAAAGRKAFVVNRIGDAGFLAGIFLFLTTLGTIDFLELAKNISRLSLSPEITTLIAICLFVGACGKSAQIPLFVWLPDAMAGPTPVSALIHAATMVTAGVYMMARLHFLFALAPLALAIVCVIAVLTAFVAGTTALVQNDIKKVLAYSTVSQLGFMFIAASCGAYWVAVFHLVTHAFFKACLFLGAGSVIHGCHHEQDMRHMGGLAKKMPITCITYGISTLAIAGIAPFAGYYSKHAILSALAGNQNPYLVEYADIIFGVVNFTAFVTAFYMTRSFVMTFLGTYRGHAHPHESPYTMTTPLIMLSILAFVGGFLLEVPLSHFLGSVLPVHGTHHMEPILDALAHSWIGLLGVGLALILYTKAAKIPAMCYRALPPLGKMLSAKYYFDEIYGVLVVRPLEWLAKTLWKTVDQGMIDAAVNGAASMVDINGEVVSSIQTGQVRQYSLMMFIGTAVIILFYLVL